VANFDGPDPQKYRITEAIINKLHTEFDSDERIEIRALGDVVLDEDISNFNLATYRLIFNADVLVWGWYGTTNDVVPISIHYEVLKPLNSFVKLQPEARGAIQILPVSDLHTFLLQTELSKDMADLTYYTVGIISYVNGDFVKASKIFEQLQSYNLSSMPYINKGDLSLMYALVLERNGETNGAHKEYSNAISIYEQTLQLEPENIKALINQGIALNGIREYDRAIINLNKAIKLDPSNANCYLNRGYSDLGKQDYQNAIVDLDKAQSLKKDRLTDLSVYQGRALAFIGKKDFLLSIHEINKSIRIYPSVPTSYILRGYVNLLLAENNKTLEIETHSDNMPNSNNNNDEESGLFWISNYLDLANKDFDYAARLLPDYYMPYIYKSYVNLQTGQGGKALENINTAIALSPNNLNAYMLRNVAYLQLKEFQKAKADIDRIIEIDPKNSQYLITRAETYLYAFASGKPLLQSVLIFKVAPSSPADFSGIKAGDMLISINQEKMSDSQMIIDKVNEYKGKEIEIQITRDHALLAFRLIPRINPPPNEGRVGIVIINSPPIELFDDIEEALKIDSESPLAYLLLGQAFTFQANSKLAKENFGQALSRTSQDPYIHYIIAQSDEFIGEPNDAIKEYKLLLELNIGPNLREWVLQKIDQLK